MKTVNNRARLQRLETERSKVLEAIHPASRRRARVADLMMRSKGSRKEKLGGLFKKEHSALSMLLGRKQRVEQVIRKADKVYRASQSRKWSV